MLVLEISLALQPFLILILTLFGMKPTMTPVPLFLSSVSPKPPLVWMNTLSLMMILLLFLSYHQKDCSTAGGTVENTVDENNVEQCNTGIQTYAEVMKGKLTDMSQAHIAGHMGVQACNSPSKNINESLMIENNKKGT